MSEELAVYGKEADGKKEEPTPLHQVIVGQTISFVKGMDEKQLEEVGVPLLLRLANEMMEHAKSIYYTYGDQPHLLHDSLLAYFEIQLALQELGYESKIHHYQPSNLEPMNT